MQKLNGVHAQYERSLVSSEDEYQAMSGGTPDPRLLAKIKRSKTDYRR